MAVTTTLLALVCVFFFAIPSSLSGHQRVAVVAARSVGCPRADEGCRPVNLVGSLLTTPAGRFQLNAGRDVVVLGRWTCRSVALPALLERRTGLVWIFRRWATARADAVAEAVGTFPGATTLRVVPGPRGCDGLVAVGSPGGSITLHLPRP